MFLKKHYRLLLLFLFISCGDRESSTNFEDIHIYTSIEDREMLNDVITNDLFSNIYYTPSPQKKYNPIWKNSSDFLSDPANSQLMLISLAEPKDSTVDIIADHFFETVDPGLNVYLVNDYFCNDQKLFLLRYSKFLLNS